MIGAAAILGNSGSEEEEKDDLKATGCEV